MRMAPHALYPVLFALVVAGACSRAPTSAPGQSFHVAVSGTPQGDGSAGRPWDLTTALAQPATMQPGDTLWLGGGTYTGSFISALAGEEGRRITVKEAPAQHAIIDGSLEVRGQYATFWGFEVMNSNPVRITESAGPDPTDYKRPTAVVVHGRGTRIVNLVVHDAGSGVAMWMPAIDAEVYGCIIFNNGWQGPFRGHGAGITAQNESGTKRIRDNIVFQQFNDGINIYGSDEAFLTGFDVEGNISFDNGRPSRAGFATDLFIGGATPVSRLNVANNYTYRSDGMGTARFGYERGIVNEDLALTDNYFVGTTVVENWQSATVRGNTFTGAQNLVELRAAPDRRIADYKWEKNTYFPDLRRRALNSTMPIVAVEGDSGRGFGYADWVKATGHDGDGSAGAKPAGTHVFVRHNEYDPTRAYIVVYNWDHARQVSVDLSDVLPKNARYEIRHVYELSGAPVAGGVFPGRPYGIGLLHADPVTIPMTPVAVRSPLGASLEAGSAGAPPEFAVFVLQQVGAGTP